MLKHATGVSSDLPTTKDTWQNQLHFFEKKTSKRDHMGVRLDEEEEEEEGAGERGGVKRLRHPVKKRGLLTTCQKGGRDNLTTCH